MTTTLCDELVVRRAHLVAERTQLQATQSENTRRRRTRIAAAEAVGR